VTNPPRRQAQALENLKFVVGGTPRGGTTYAANVLRALGFKAGHEAIFKRDEVDWRTLRSGRYDVDVSGIIPFHLGIIQEHEVPIIHLIRHPVPSINSMLRYFQGAYKPNEAVQRWYKSHKALSDLAVLTIRLETFRTDINRFAAVFCPRTQPAELDEATAQADKGTSTPGTTFDWFDLPSDVRDFAENIGYEPF